MKTILALLLLACGACSTAQTTNPTLRATDCEKITDWDGCGVATECMQARAWFTAQGDFRETWICIEKTRK